MSTSDNRFQRRPASLKERAALEAFLRRKEMIDMECIDSRSSCQTLPASPSSKAQLRTAELRIIFIAKCRFVANRAERKLPLDRHSILNLVRAYRALIFAEAGQ
jgi:hypothetical protein